MNDSSSSLRILPRDHQFVESLREEKTAEDLSGTPNDVRMFPRVHKRTESIPINHTERSASEIQMDEGEALAEYRDLVMYQRIVGGSVEKLKQPSDHQAADAFATRMHTRLVHHAVHSGVDAKAFAGICAPLVVDSSAPRTTWRAVVNEALPYFEETAYHHLEEDHQEEGVFELDL